MTRSSSAPLAAADRRVPRQWRTKYLAAPVFALVLGACGGSTAVESSTAAAESGTSQDEASSSVVDAERAAASNTPELQTADNVFDVEVLSVADGSVSTLRQAVTGDRPVLVWFWAPH